MYYSNSQYHTVYVPLRNAPAVSPEYRSDDLTVRVVSSFLNFPNYHQA